MNASASAQTSWDDKPLRRSLKLNVLGGGVVGMTTAMVLASEGCQVTVFRADHWSKTTSSVAAAYWRPVSVGGYRRSWAIATYHYFRSLSFTPATGVSIVPAVEYLDLHDDAAVRGELEELWWRQLPGIDFQEGLPSALRCRFDEIGDAAAFGLTKEMLLEGEFRFTRGFTFNTPVIRMPDYLRWLETQATHLGVQFTEKRIRSLHELVDGSCDAVINCSGFEASGVLQESQPQEKERCVPREGLVLRVKAPGVKKLIGVHSGRFNMFPIYIVPRAGSENDVILGGCVIPRAEYDIGLGLPKPNMQLAETLLRRCQAIEPALAHLSSAQDILHVEPLVGLRPWRDEVRLELDASFTKPVIHNYGHGGAGVTLSFGCALAATELARAL